MPKISEFIHQTGPASADFVPIVHSGTTEKTTLAELPISTAAQAALDLKAPLASPTFTGTVSGVSKTMVGLSNVDNTADTAKPVSTAQQTALDLKANLASPTFTGTVGGITKTMVGLGSVDNTTDAGKPVSTAQQTEINLKASVGVSQTWQNMAGSRAHTTVYTNSTGRPIAVSVGGTCTVAAGYYVLNIAGIAVSQADIPLNGRFTMFGIVPNGATYVLSKGGADTLTTLMWAELR